VDPTPPTPEEIAQQKYDTLQGKYNAETAQLRQELRETQRMLSNIPSETDFGDFSGVDITQEERDEFGEELITLINKAAKSQIAPVVEKLQNQNKELQARVQQASQTMQSGAREQLLSQLRAQVPDFEKLNDDKDFLDWLDRNDLYSGNSRRNLLAQAYEANDTNRVIAFFTGYKQEHTASQNLPPPTTGEAQTPNGLETLVAPGRPAGSVDSGAQKSGRVWKESEYQLFLKHKQQGKISAEDAAKYDLEFYQAGLENRIQYGV
jgi:hypothetical protein